MTITRRFTLIGAALSLIALAAPARAAAQTPAMRLSLAEALRLAQDKSEAVAVARAGESRADAGLQRARSDRFPQVSFLGSYDRTLASEFSAAFDASGPVCSPFSVDATRPLTDRVSEIERAASCGSIGPSFNLGKLPFGQRNAYRATFAFSQALYAGGRIDAQQTQAEFGRQSSALITTSTEAQVALDVTRAFFDAALSDRLVTIAESAYQQASAAYDQVRLSFEAGRQPEFELLRAQVSRDNQRPLVIRRRADRDTAYLRLRQLLELPAGTPLDLDVDLDGTTLPAPAPFAEALVAPQSRPASDHVSVKTAEALVGVREAAVTIAHSQRLPTVSLSSSLGSVGYPSSGLIPGTDDFRTNWSVGASVQVPIFTGQRLRAGELSARADLAEAQAVLKQTKELVELNAETAKQDLAAAEAVWDASAGTIQQAERAYQIAELRNREGLSTQLELSDSRLALQFAQANRAQAARDVQVARARVALLSQLPVR
jgi:outer membrane protein TolC